MDATTPPAPEGSALAELRDDPSSRKSFLRKAGAGAAGSLAVLLVACGSDDSTTSSTTDTGTSTPSPTDAEAMDLEILNFALTLEHLEATFYREVIASGLVEDKKLAELVKTIGQHEQDHVDALTKAVESLGEAPAEKPRTNFKPVLDKGLETVLETAATVENLGAAAYLGQAPRITDDELLASALAIHSVEARHAAALNMLVGRGFKAAGPLEGSLPDGAFATPMQMDAVLAAVKPYLA